MNKVEQHQIEVNGETITFFLERKKVKHVYLKVRADMKVMVSANHKVSLVYIKEFVADKATWIINHLERFKEIKQQETVKEYASGETVRYLGQQYCLQVVESPKEGVWLSEGDIYLSVRDKADYHRKKDLLYKWLRQEAAVIFRESLERVYPKLQQYGINKPEIKVRKMKTRWGSCIMHRQVVQLNLLLVKAPIQCVDYVMVHELSHFRHPNHSKDFYNFLTALMPDWKERKTLLNKEVAREL